MIALDESSVDSAAPDSDSAKNGRGLVVKGKFTKFHIAEEVLLFGECQGSGKEPYRCSVDYARPDQPTFRCSCPSRKLPCKHCLGLMYAFVLKKPFTEAVVPDDLAAKREKLATRVEKKAEEATKPKVVNKAALAKKVKAQLDGMDVLEKLTLDAVRLGIGNMNAKLAGEMEAQAKQLGNAYLPGAQAALNRYTQLFADEDGKFAAKSEAKNEVVFGEALDRLTRLNAILKQGRAYLKARLEDENLTVPTDSGIAAWLGHAWQLTELKAVGLTEANAELVQLAFNSHDDAARKEYIDTGVWMNLVNGKIRVTQTLRPYKAAKFIKSEDSFFQVAQVPELCVYPGGVNPRIRWDGHTNRPLEHKDYKTIRGHAHADFAAAIKDVKTNLKGVLSDKTPIVALAYETLGRVGETLVLEDAKGERLTLTDAGMAEEQPSCDLLPLLPPTLLKQQTMIVRFRHDLDTRKLQIKPLSIVSANAVVRLTL